MDETQFKQQLQEQGYGEAQLVEYQPNMDSDMHTHDFSAYALVLGGEFILVTEEGAVSHQPGEACKLAAGTRHAERTGPDGAKILIGKK